MHRPSENVQARNYACTGVTGERASIGGGAVDVAVTTPMQEPMREPNQAAATFGAGTAFFAAFFAAFAVLVLTAFSAFACAMSP